MVELWSVSWLYMCLYRWPLNSILCTSPPFFLLSCLLSRPLAILWPLLSPPQVHSLPTVWSCPSLRGGWSLVKGWEPIWSCRENLYQFSQALGKFLGILCSIMSPPSYRPTPGSGERVCHRELSRCQYWQSDIFIFSSSSSSSSSILI